MGLAGGGVALRLLSSRSHFAVLCIVHRMGLGAGGMTFCLSYLSCIAYCSSDGSSKVTFSCMGGPIVAFRLHCEATNLLLRLASFIHYITLHYICAIVLSHANT